MPDSTLPESERLFTGGDQRRIRPTAGVRDLAEFLDFLRDVEDVFGPTVKPRRIAHGDHFRL